VVGGSSPAAVTRCLVTMRPTRVATTPGRGKLVTRDGLFGTGCRQRVFLTHNNYAVKSDNAVKSAQPPLPTMQWKKYAGYSRDSTISRPAVARRSVTCA
jgi:hypothetical protein